MVSAGSSHRGVGGLGSVMARRFRAELIEPAPAGGWYVSNGDQSVGPVALELLVRGVETGRVPMDAFIRHEAWKVWRPLRELTIEAELRTEAELAAALTDDEGPATIRESSPVIGMPMAPDVPAVVAREAALKAAEEAAVAAAAAAARGAFPAPLDLVATFEALAAAHGIALAPPLGTGPDAGEGRASRPPPRSSRRSVLPRSLAGGLVTDDVASGARPADSSDRMDGDELAGATDLREALLLFLGAVVRRLDADGALLHRVDEMGAAVACAHGRGAGDALGARTSLTDPSFLAASSGHALIAEPEPGAGGVVIRARLEAVCGAPIAHGAAGMLPIVAGGRLRAFVEIGKVRPMAMREWAEAERLVRTLVARMHAAQW